MDRAVEPVKASGDRLAGSTRGRRLGRPRPPGRGRRRGLVVGVAVWPAPLTTGAWVVAAAGAGASGGVVARERGPVRPQGEQLEQLDLVGHLEVDGVEVAPGPGRVGEAALGGGPERGHERPRPGHRGVERDP